MPSKTTRACIPAGTGDIFGIEMRRIQTVIDVIRNTYEAFGFDPLHTPVLENAMTFKGHHGEGEKLLFRFRDSEGNDLVNRYDLTVPLARFAASHPEIPRPFKRYQIASVFRDDKPDLGHFREFTQCDGDSVGNSSPSADAEVINVAYTGLERLGFEDFTLRVNHRGIIKAIAEKAGITDRDGVTMVQRALDFSDKVTKSGLSGIRSDLKAYGAPAELIEIIIEMITIEDDDTLSKLASIGMALSHSENGRNAVEELEAILGLLPRVVFDKVTIDLTLARGADYYTGFILEGVINSVPVGAVLGGGRYDNLVGKFNKRPEPAVGMAFGLERVVTAMKILGMFENVNTQKRVLVVSGTNTSHNYALESVMLLRQSNFHVDYVPHGVIEDVEAYSIHRGFTAVIHLAGNSIGASVAYNDDEYLADVLSKLG